jgi:glycosyltransferase involved in cell wall biosynthesis
MSAPRGDGFSLRFLSLKPTKKGFGTIILNDLSSLWLAPVFRQYGYHVLSLLHLYLQTRDENPLGHSRFEYYLLKWSAKFCDEIFSVNKNNRDIFGTRVKFIGNYVPDWFMDAPKTAEKQYDFILIARLAKQKNIPLFLQILGRLNEESSKSFNALIVGEGEEQSHIEQLVESYGLSQNVTMQNWAAREELPGIYDLGKCFVISSLRGTLIPYAPVEFKVK